MLMVYDERDRWGERSVLKRRSTVLGLVSLSIPLVIVYHVVPGAG